MKPPRTPKHSPVPSSALRCAWCCVDVGLCHGSAEGTGRATHTFDLLLSPPGLVSVSRTDTPQGNFCGDEELGVELELSGAVTGWRQGMPEMGPHKLQSNKAKGKVLQLSLSNPKHIQGASPVTPGV